MATDAYNMRDVLSLQNSATDSQTLFEDMQLEPISDAHRLHEEFALYDLQKHERDTYMALLKNDKHGEVIVMPNHHISSHGELKGYKYMTSEKSLIETLPLSRNMFFGFTATECAASTLNTRVDMSTNNDAIRLLSKPSWCKDTMQLFVDHLRALPSTNTADFECIPHNADSAQQPEVNDVSNTGRQRSKDSKDWNLDLPDSIGIYHAFVRVPHKDKREHKLFVVCSGGCRQAADQYYNMVLDLAGTDTTTQELFECEETWWLRRACVRNRCRLMYMMAEAFDLHIPNIEDVHHHIEGVRIAVPTIDTPRNDIEMLRNKSIAILSECVDPTNIRNGILHDMHPNEGLWIFKGPARAQNVNSTYGAMFGEQKSCGAFPVAMHEVSKRNTPTKQNNLIPTVSVKHGNNIVRIDSTQVPADVQTWTKYDEQCMKHLEKMHWARENGIIELIPISVAVF
jgi:hypothetical protein